MLKKNIIFPWISVYMEGIRRRTDCLCKSEEARFASAVPCSRILTGNEKFSLQLCAHSSLQNSSFAERIKGLP